MPYGITKPSPKPMWANSAATSDLFEPSDSVKAAGWTATNPCPPYQWENWIHKYCMTAARYLMGRSVADYDADEIYTVGDVVQYGTPLITYQCKVQPPGPGIVPTNTDYWEIYGVSWLPDALKTSLATLLPPLIVSAMSTQLGIGGTGNSAKGSMKVAGFQIAWNYVTFTTGNGYISGGFPISQPITWSNAFTALYGVVATPLEGNTVISIQAQSITGCNVTPQTLVSTNPANPLYVFVLAVGSPAA